MSFGVEKLLSLMQCSQQENKIQNILLIPSSSVRNQVNRKERNARETRIGNQEWAIQRHLKYQAQDEKKSKNTTNHRKLKRCATWTPPKQKPGMNPGAHEW